MEKKLENTLEEINPKRRAFVKTLLHASYVVPTVISVSMVDQTLDLTTAHAQSGYIPY